MEFNASQAMTYIVDDEFAILDSLTLLIKTSGRQVKGFDSAEAFLNGYDPNLPGCLILDVTMPAMGGLELQEELAKRDIHIPIIFISGNADIPDSAKAFRAGALDFLEKPFDNQILLARIDEAIQKDIEARKHFVEKHRIQECFKQLTAREREVLQLVISSHSNKEIAKILDISYRTIEAHRGSIMRKMQVENIAALVSLTTKMN